MAGRAAAGELLPGPVTLVLQRRSGVLCAELNPGLQRIGVLCARFLPVLRRLTATCNADAADKAALRRGAEGEGAAGTRRRYPHASKQLHSGGGAVARHAAGAYQRQR